MPWLTRIKLTDAKQLPIVFDLEKQQNVDKKARAKARERKQREKERIQYLEHLHQQQIEQQQRMRNKHYKPSRTELNSHKHLFY